jgi:hypothetical protein
MEWVPVAMHLIGLAALVFFIVFWAATQRVEPLLIGTAGMMAGVGEAGRFARDLVRESKKPREEP